MGNYRKIWKKSTRTEGNYMKNMKDFWETQEETWFGKGIPKEYIKGWKSATLIIKEQQGMMFWDRGGKQFVETATCMWYAKDIPWQKLIKEANNCVEHVELNAYNARDFLDALVCLGEEKIKELIKELN